MLEFFTIGFLLGLSHSTDADHLSAISSILIENNSLLNALKIGSVWGLGHSLTLLVMGATSLMLGAKIPENISNLLEIIVGFMLVALGANVFRKLLLKTSHLHLHSHNKKQHFHAHCHNNKTIMGDHRKEQHSHEHHPTSLLKSLSVGVMHGIAGSAVLIILVMQTATSFSNGLLYIAIFGIGSIIGMASLSVVIFYPLHLSKGRFNLTHKTIQFSIASITVALGLYIIIAGFWYQ
ncbi:MAG: urease accessory protein [Gammaproteobacteria bacterium]|nr:MAG: urease accessory protein [Gammaproteobacteria bacterium]